jgi:hypothetical protein
MMGQNITPQIGGLDVLHRSPMTKRDSLFFRSAHGQERPTGQMEFY